MEEQKALRESRPAISAKSQTVIDLPIAAYRTDDLSVLTLHIMLHTRSRTRRRPLARTNLTLPEELLREVDELAGPRGRSQFVADAVTWKVKRERLRRALDAARGVFVGTEWQMSADQAYRWVRSMREDDE